MKLVTYRRHVEAAARLGAIVNGRVVDLARLGAAHDIDLPTTMLEFIDLGPDAVATATQMIADAAGRYPLGCAHPLADVRLLAPIPRPRKNIFGIGLNYTEHVAESAQSLDTSPDLPRHPVIFSKPPTTVIGPDEPIRHNAAITQQLDWEVELAAIIGTTARATARARTRSITSSATAS
jgi:2-keto-4-pentenoate hydratase/2-oxohepta-3-ene-1,7-dioic acid hydratase in catechol pathway